MQDIHGKQRHFHYSPVKNRVGCGKPAKNPCDFLRGISLRDFVGNMQAFHAGFSQVLRGFYLSCTLSHVDFPHNITQALMVMQELRRC